MGRKVFEKEPLLYFLHMDTHKIDFPPNVITCFLLLHLIFNLNHCTSPTLVSPPPALSSFSACLLCLGFHSVNAANTATTMSRIRKWAYSNEQARFSALQEPLKLKSLSLILLCNWVPLPVFPSVCLPYYGTWPSKSLSLSLFLTPSLFLSSLLLLPNHHLRWSLWSPPCYLLTCFLPHLASPTLLEPARVSAFRINLSSI